MIKEGKSSDEIMKSLGDRFKVLEDVKVDDVYDLLKKEFSDLKLISNGTKSFARGLVVIPSYLAKGLEFDATIVYTYKSNAYTNDERYLYYVACTRSQHHLIIYNQAM